jgi:copper(I)-binding protein
MSASARCATLVVALAMFVPTCSNESKDITVDGAWARSPMKDVGAVYFTIANDGDGDDRLVAARAEIADRAEIHETRMEADQAEMRPVDAVVIPAHGAVTFEPGGYHVMLFDLTRALEVGEDLSLVLTFEEAGEMEVAAEVRAFVEG